MYELGENLELAEVVIALQILDAESMGRYRLATLMNTSRARTREILNFLTDTNLAQASKGRGGTNLTESGRELVDQIAPLFFLDYLKTRCTVDPTIFPQSESYFGVFTESTNLETNGLFERDIAVREGADGAITLVRRQKEWIYPDSKNFKIQDIGIGGHEYTWNVLIVAFADIPGKALRGAVAAAMYHVEDRIIELFSKERNNH